MKKGSSAVVGIVMSVIIVLALAIVIISIGPGNIADLGKRLLGFADCEQLNTGSDTQVYVCAQNRDAIKDKLNNNIIEDEQKVVKVTKAQEHSSQRGCDQQEVCYLATVVRKGAS
ncbi:MAG: hypothetical protein HC945_02170 [Nitrosarchaeum sp.]|nr:hypothetical protein [Nitrosarchaeum sp.]